MSKYIYLAGLLDGEGSIMLSRRQANCNRIPTISVSSTTKEIVDWLKDNFGGHVSKHRVYQGHHKQSWSWKLSKQSEVFDILEHSVPYMLEPKKVARANYILDGYLAVTNRNGKYNEKERQAKIEFEEHFLTL